MARKIRIGCVAVVLLVALVAGVFGYLLLHRTGGRYFDSNGVQIYFTDEGQGEPVVLVHGVGANADLNWRRPGVIRRLARDYRVIAFDLRGHGRSGQPIEPSRYGIELVEDIPRLMDHLGIEKAHVAGYSLGGFILLKLLTVHPDRVQSAALCAAGWIDPDNFLDIPSPYRPPERIYPLPPPRKESPQQASVIPAFASKGIFHTVRNWIGDQLMSEVVKKALKQSYNQLAVYRPELEENEVPSVCFIGTNDGFYFLSEDLAVIMNHLERIEIPGANHFTTPFYPAFKRGLRDFFAAHPMDKAATAK